MKVNRVLILDDESTIRTALFRTFERKGYQVVTAQSSEEARSYCRNDSNDINDKKFDLALIDAQVTNDKDLEFLNYLKLIYPDIQIILLTDQFASELEIKSVNLSPFQFLQKPFNFEELIILSEKILKSFQLEKKLNDQKINFEFSNIIGESDALKNCLSLVERVADSDATILVTGESGTGKELIAKAIHNRSSRSNGPFIAINCGAIPSELLESELFGHVKGAFTGAIANRAGRFELADEGTLFLDEIGDLNPSLQVKILRALQEKNFEPVGSTKTIHVNVRVITATNIDLDKAVLDGRFREDLYYRLNVIPIQLPPLRERKIDIPLLLQFFLDKFNKSKLKKMTGFSQDSLQSLIHYPWPGNIRELENLVERLSILKGFGEVATDDLPLKYKSNSSISIETTKIEIPENGLDFNTAVDQFENALILKALEKTGWNKNQASILLRLNRTTLVEKMKKKGLGINNEGLNIEGHA